MATEQLAAEEAERFLAGRIGLADDSTRVVAIMAVLAADGVRRDTLHAAGQAGALAPGGRRMAADAVDDVLAALTERSLLTASPDGRAIVMPGAAAAVTRSWLAGQGQQVPACQAAAAALETRARTLDASRDRPAARDFSEQVAALLGPAAEPAGQAGEELAIGLLRLRFLALYYLIELGDSVPQAVAVGEALTADLERMRGADDPDTLNARNSLAAAYLAAGRPADAILLFERTLVGLERTQGPNHPDTLASQSNLAAAYQDAGRVGEAILLLRLTVAARERMLGDAHRDTLNSCGNLAAAYRAAGRPSEAVPLLERTLAGREQVLGAGHPDTEAARANLDQARLEPDRPPEALRPPDPFPAADPLPADALSADQFPVEQPPAEPPATEPPPADLPEAVTEILPVVPEPEPRVIAAEESAAAEEPAVGGTPFTWESVVAKVTAAAPVAREPALGEEAAVAETPRQEPAPEEPGAVEPEVEEPAPVEPAGRGTRGRGTRCCGTRGRGNGRPRIAGWRSPRASARSRAGHAAASRRLRSPGGQRPRAQARAPSLGSRGDRCPDRGERRGRRRFPVARRRSCRGSRRDRARPARRCRPAGRRLGVAAGQSQRDRGL